VAESPEGPRFHEVSRGEASSSSDLFTALVRCVQALAMQTAAEQECIPVSHASLITSASADKSHGVDLTGAVLVNEVRRESDQIK
jgi:hypothetical protein